MIKEIRSSKLSRYMVCSGYGYLDVEETPAGEPAREGTACGEYLEHLLTDQEITSSQASNGFYYNDDIKFYMSSLASEIKSRATTPVLCETRIDWITRAGITIRGQYDASFIDSNGRLCIEDLKYGWGIVEVKENWQLLAYAIGEVIRRNQVFPEISLKIHQPRPHHEDGTSREWLITYDELLAYKEKIELRAEELASGKKDFQTSSQCKYCKGAGEACPAFSRAFYNSLEVSTQFFQDSITDSELSAQLDQIKRAEEILKIKHDSLIELGTSRIKKGRIIPGYVQVDKYSHRSWKNGITPESLRLMTGIKAVEESFMTPAKAEKLGISKALIKQLTESKLVGVKLEKKNGTDVGNKIFGNTNPVGGQNE